MIPFVSLSIDLFARRVRVVIRLGLGRRPSQPPNDEAQSHSTSAHGDISVPGKKGSIVSVNSIVTVHSLRRGEFSIESG